MPVTQRLSEVVNEIEEAVRNRFSGRTFWIKAETADVKKYADKQWCFLKFIEKSGSIVTADIKGVFWSGTYGQIQQFERATQQVFGSGLEITCNVAVRFHKRYGLTLEVMEIDYAYAVGKLELERKQTIERLVNDGVLVQDVLTGRCYSSNNQLELPMVVQRIALITAPDSDGQRDFRKVLVNNKYGYAFAITEYLTRIQGDEASGMIVEQLNKILEQQGQYDVVAIVRGGGSDTDFKAFNDYELAKRVATSPVPVLTGIGHDRNTSITDMVARQYRTPTETATYLIDLNMNFDQEIEGLRERLYRATERSLERARTDLQHMRQRVVNLSPETILKKGFAILMMGDQIITDPAKVLPGAVTKTLLKNEMIYSTVTNKTTNGNNDEL